MSARTCSGVNATQSTTASNSAPPSAAAADAGGLEADDDIDVDVGVEEMVAEAEPVRFEPPWTKKSTGSPVAPPFGAQTFR